MKILITYASAGSGHLKAAEALYNYFTSNHPDTEVQLVDILDKTNGVFKIAYAKGYNFLVTRAPWLWSVLFYVTDAPLLRTLARFLTFPFDFLNTFRFRYFLRKENPDTVISTHFLPSLMVSFLKGRGVIDSRLVTVVTDFGVHPFWIQPHTDAYVAASEHTKAALMRFGVEEPAIKVFGIPVAEKFSGKRNKKTVCAKLGIPGDTFTVLLITGSFGIGPLEEIAVMLSRDVRVMVVCARNKTLYQKLTVGRLPNIQVYGFIDNVEDLMAAADIIITKPGGLTVSETLSMDLPPLFISAIFGQETENARIVSGQKAGVIIDRTADIRKIVLDLKDHPVKLQEFRKNIAGIKKPFAARDVCEFVLTMR